MVHRKGFEDLPPVDGDAGADDEANRQLLGWEAEVLRRIAPRLAEIRKRAVQDEAALGWEAAGLRRLAQVTGEEA